MQLTDKQKKISIVVGGILVLGTIIYFITKTPKSDTSGSATDPTGNNEGGGSGTTYTFNPTNVAQSLYEAMADFGTDEEAIFNLLAPVSQTQFGQVVQKFGSRVYNSWTGGTSGGSAQPLKTWLKEELSSSDYEILRKKFPSYL